MDQKILFKQMLDFQKAGFDNSFNAMAKLQENGEKMVNMFINQAAWLPEDGKKSINDWIKAYKDGRDKFKDSVNSNFNKVQEYFTGSETKAAA
ncbi:Phasin domain-containing protein [Candidatus Magnetomoraceae bacterium gMMP-15]